ncbi:MAG: hypothetical protein KY468_02250 [Armatimonadetes bacterium]|nr:hypothetical protein [Armatimonadota bacterium]
MKLFPFLPAFLALILIGAAPPNPLVGRWISEDMFTITTLRFLPDGRYTREIRVGDVPLQAQGRYKRNGDSITFSPKGESEEKYELTLDGNRLTLSGAGLPEPKTFEKEPGSEKALLEETRQGDAQKSKEDDVWRKRIAVGPIPAKAPTSLAGVPKDPNPKRVLKGAQVFQQPQLYLRLTPMTLTSAGGRQSTVFNSVKWHFSPNGRVFIRWETFRPGQRYDADKPQGEIRTFWAAYRITPGKETDRLYVETDGGEKFNLSLEDGRRNLVWDDQIYSQVHWQNELMRRQQK